MEVSLGEGNPDPGGHEAVVDEGVDAVRHLETQFRSGQVESQCEVKGTLTEKLKNGGRRRFDKDFRLTAGDFEEDLLSLPDV